MAYEFVRRADGLVMCRLDPQEKAIIAQVAQEVGDLVRADLGLSSEPAAVREAAASEDPLTRLEAELAGVDREPSDSAVRRLFPASSSDAAQARSSAGWASGTSWTTPWWRCPGSIGTSTPWARCRPRSCSTTRPPRRG